MGNIERDCKYILASKISNCTDGYLKSFIKKNHEKCPQYCPLECDTVDYSFSLRSYIDSSSDNPVEIFKNSTRQLKVYFKEMKFKKLNDSPKTEIFSFISEIGGILCLFIGVSFVSFFELAQLLLEISFILFKKTQIHNNNNNIKK